MPYTGSDLNKLIEDQSTQTIKISVQELIDIYKDNWNNIIRAELSDQFTDKEFNKLKWLMTREINLIKRIVNEIAMIYKNPAKRIAFTEKELKKNEKGEKLEIAIIQRIEDENYEKMLMGTDLNVTMKTVNRYTELTNHVLLRPVWRDNILDYDILLFNNAEILTDPEDWKRIIAIKFFVGLELPEFTNKEKTDFTSDGIKWGGRTGVVDKMGIATHKYFKAFLYTLEDIKDENDRTLTKGKIYTIEQRGREEEIIKIDDNPYRDEKGNVILPFILFSKEQSISQLLDFTTGNDLRDANINIAINMIHLNALLKYQSYKQVWLKTSKKNQFPDKMQFGPTSIFTIWGEDNAGSATGDIGTLDLQSAIDRVWGVIKDRAKIVLAQYGFDVEAFERSGSPTSGFHLKIKKEAILEKREDQLPVYRNREKEIFKISRIVWNYHNPNEKIDIKSKHKIDFGEITFPKSIDEEAKEFEFLKRNNVKTDIDLIIDDNPDLTREEAMEIFEKNKAFNSANQVVFTPTVQPNNKEKDNDKKKGQSVPIVK